MVSNKESSVKKFVILHYGFDSPTTEIMAAWGAWFEEIGDNIVDQGHFPRGREISKSGSKELPLTAESITGFNIITAENLDEAEKMAQSNPFISSIRVYEVMSE
jgi:hypothetical protein